MNRYLPLLTSNIVEYSIEVTFFLHLIIALIIALIKINLRFTWNLFNYIIFNCNAFIVMTMVKKVYRRLEEHWWGIFHEKDVRNLREFKFKRHTWKNPRLGSTGLIVTYGATFVGASNHNSHIRPYYCPP